MKQKLVRKPSLDQDFVVYAEVPIVFRPFLWVMLEYQFHTVAVRTPDDRLMIVHQESGSELGSVVIDLQDVKAEERTREATSLIIQTYVHKFGPHKLVEGLRNAETVLTTLTEATIQ